MVLISPGGENLLDFHELWQMLSSYEGDLMDPRWWPHERKAIDRLIHEKGSMTLLLQLGRKVHVHAPTRDKV